MNAIRSAIVLGLLAAGCGGERSWPIDSAVTAPEGVRVAADSQGIGSFTVKVTNNTPAPVMFDRDAITLKTPKGERRRTMDKAMPTYDIPSGESKMITVKYDTRDLDDNQVVTLTFDGAVREDNGQNVNVPPMRYKTRSSTGDNIGP